MWMSIGASATYLRGKRKLEPSKYEENGFRVCDASEGAELSAKLKGYDVLG